jgi:nitrous oxidase accessory protein
MAGLLMGLATGAWAAPGHAQVPAREIVVGSGQALTTIGQALDTARDGDRIRVLPGVYREQNLQISASITLEGEGWPEIDAGGRHTILAVTADSVTIRGFHLRGVGMSQVRDNSAILVEGGRHCVIENNRLTGTHFGIYLARAEGCRIRNNRITGTAEREAVAGNGIHLWNVASVTVEGNVITGHRDGIYLEFAKGAVIRDNESQDNLRYGLHFMFSDDSRYERNTFARNGAGVAVMYSTNVQMTGNLFEDNWGTSAYGLLIKDVRDSTIEENTFRGNTTAIFSEGADRLVFRRNRVIRNGWAVKILASSQDNLFTENDFIENSFDVITNSRRNFNTFRGNHWSRYDGYDLTGDGVGDVPYRPVRLFSFVVEQSPAAIVLLRSLFVELLELAERVLPILTPETLVDDEPRMREVVS